MVRIQVEEIRLLLLYLHHRSLQINKRKKIKVAQGEFAGDSHMDAQNFSFEFCRFEVNSNLSN